MSDDGGTVSSEPPDPESRGQALAPAPKATEDHLTVTYAELLRFFVPLSFLPFLIHVTKVIANAAIARLPEPEAVFAAYSVARSLVSPILSPLWMMRRAAVALIDDPDSYRVCRRVFGSIGAIVGFCVLLTAFTPLGPWLLRHVMGITDETVIYHAMWTLRILVLMPLSHVGRDISQGVTISLKRTRVVPVGTMLRVIFTAGFLFIVVTGQSLSGAAAATTVWVGGIGLEGVFLWFYLRWSFGDVAAASEAIDGRRHRRLDVRAALAFFLPLFATSLLGQFVKPLINAVLARTHAPSVAIGAFAVSQELAYFLDAPVRMLHQCGVVYGGEGEEARTVIFRFSVAVGVLFAGLIWATAISPAAPWLLATVIAVPVSLLAPSILCLKIFALLPLVECLRAYYWGILMEERDTMVIGAARAGNLAATAGAMGLGRAGGWFAAGGTVHPAALGAVGYVAGVALESLIMARYLTGRRRDAARQRVSS